jgi:hypothetical protein
MKTRANLERILIAVLGVTLCFADAVSAAERDKKLLVSITKEQDRLWGG